MKKELFYYSILILVITGLLFSETLILNFKSENTSKVIEIDQFNKLDIDLACNFYVSIGEEQKVVFEGPSKYLDNIEAQMENGVLKISSKNLGFLAQFFGDKMNDGSALNVYIKLTSADQLVCPRKGNLITNESSLYRHVETNSILSHSVNNILRLFGAQLGHVSLL